MVPVDDPDIEDETVLWRRISPKHLRPGPLTYDLTQRSDSSFRTGEISVHIASLTSLEAVKEKYPTHRVAAITAGAIRRIGCIVIKDPTEEDISHALVLRGDDPGARITNAQAREINNAAKWAD